MCLETVNEITSPFNVLFDASLLFDLLEPHTHIILNERRLLLLRALCIIIIKIKYLEFEPENLFF